MAEQIDDAFKNQPLNKAGWLQALDELEREYVAFQASANRNSTEHGPTNANRRSTNDRKRRT